MSNWVSLTAPAVGLSLALFSITPIRWLAFPVLVGLGFSVIIAIAGSNTLIQTQVHEDYRGRVMAIFTMAFLGIAPLGSLAVGSLAHVFCIRQTLAACGVIMLLAGMIYRRFAIRESRRA